MDPLPFSRKTFQLIIDKFRLPASTPWAFSTTSLHFHQYRKSGDRLGMPNFRTLDKNRNEFKCFKSITFHQVLR